MRANQADLGAAALHSDGQFIRKSSSDRPSSTIERRQPRFPGRRCGNRAPRPHHGLQRGRSGGGERDADRPTRRTRNCRRVAPGAHRRRGRRLAVRPHAPPASSGADVRITGLAPRFASLVQAYDPEDLAQDAKGVRRIGALSTWAGRRQSSWPMRRASPDSSANAPPLSGAPCGGAAASGGTTCSMSQPRLGPMPSPSCC